MADGTPILVDLEQFVNSLSSDSSHLDKPELGFFKQFLLSWGVKIPPPPNKYDAFWSGGAPKSKFVSISDEENDREDDDPDRFPEDPPPYPALGPSSEVQLTDEQMDRQSKLKQEATDAIEDDNREVAIAKYTAAIEIGNASALMFAKRAELLLKCKRPRACINDCDAAIRLNPESAKAIKSRGKAYRSLGKWEEAFKDLSKAQSLDFDEDTAKVQEFVSKKWKVISERRNRKRLNEEKKKEEELQKKRAEALAKRKAEQEAEAKRKAEFEERERKRMRESKPAAPAQSAKGRTHDPNFLSRLMSHPEISHLLQDPHVMAATMDIVENPGNEEKYGLEPHIYHALMRVKAVMDTWLGEKNA